MKSFFQRFQDSQPGAAKSRTKDPAYRQWIPTKSDKDRAQLSDGLEQRTASSSKPLPTKTAGIRPPDVPGPLGRVTSDNTTRFSTIPAAPISRHLPPSLPLSQTHPPGPSTLKVPHLKPPDEAKEKSKPTTKRTEAAEISANEKDTTSRVRSGRPSRSGQTIEPPAPQQHQFWRPSDMKVLNPEKERKKERQKQGGEITGGDSRTPKNYDPNPKNERPDDHWTDRVEGGSRQRTELKGLERGLKDRRRDEAVETRKPEKWEQQERDIAQVREREARESERLKERKEKGREKVREKGNEREREPQRETTRDQDRAEERDKKKLEGKEKERAVRERQDLELQAREQRERERKERRAKERQIEKERWERELLERMRREREKGRERLQKEQKERERLQQEKWEREQEEIERKELERLERDRLKEQEITRRKESEPQRQGPDFTTVDLLQMGRQKQDSQKRERPKEREDKERRWRGDKLSEQPIPALVDTRDQNAPRSKSSKTRKEGASDSEREQAKMRELDRRRTSRMLTQSDTPPKLDQRNIQETEAVRPSESSIKVRGLKQHIYSSGVGDSTANQQHLKNATRDEGYGSEFNPSTQNSPDPPGRDVLMTAPPTQQVRSPSFLMDVPQFLGPSGYVTSVQHQRSDTAALVGHSSHPTQHSTRATPPDTWNQVRQSPKEVTELVNRPTVPVLQAQLPVHQTRPAAATSQVYDSGRTSSRPVLVPTEVANLPSLGPSATSVFPTAHTHTPQENRPFPPAATFQASHLSVPPSSRVPLNTPDEPTPALKGTNSINVPVTPSPHEGHTVLPTAKSKSSRPNAQSSPEPAILETRLLPASHRPDPNTLSGPSLQDRHAPIAIPQNTAPPVHGLSLTPSVQQSHQTNTTTKNSPLHNYHPLTNYGHLPENTARNDKESPEPPTSRKELTRQIPPVQPVPPVTSVSTASRPVTVNKRSNTVPPRYEDSVQPLFDPKVLKVSRPSPTYHIVKIQDTIPPADITNMLQPNKVDPRLRTSPPADKISLQESALPSSRRYHTDTSGYDSRTDRPPQSIVLPVLADESRKVASENKPRDPNLARMLSPPQIDNQDTAHSRHQRYYSEGEIVRSKGKSSPRSQPAEDTQISKAPQASIVFESKQKGTQPSAFEPDASSRGPNVAFHAPATGGGPTSDRKFPGAETQPSVTGIPQAPGARLPQPSQGLDTNRVSHLLSHYERIEQAAQLGGTISRPGTAIPRDTARVITHEPPFQNVLPTSHSLPGSAAQIERPRTSNGVRPSTLNAQPPIYKTDRASRPDTSSSAQPSAIKATVVEPRHDQVPYQTTDDGHSTLKKSRPNPVAQSARPSTADNSHGTNNRPRPDAPTLSHKVSYSEGMIINESMGGFRAATVLNNGLYNPPNEPVKSAEGLQPHRIFPISEDKVQARQHSNTKEEPEVVYRHPAHPAPSQVHNGSMAHRDETEVSLRDRTAIFSSTPSRQRKDSLPRIHPEDNSTKVQGSGEVSTEDPRALQQRPNHSYGHPRASAPAVDVRQSSQRAELVQVEDNRHASVPARKNMSETNVTTSQLVPPAQPIPFDERARNKHSQDHSPHAPEHSPVHINPASISPHRTGNSGYSKLEEESRPRQHKSTSVQVKDPRLADLLTPPKVNDATHHSYLRDARRTLVSKLEREPNVSPNSVANNLNGGPESSVRLRGSSGRGEHSPGNTGVDSNPSGLSSSSPSHTQHPDPSAKDYGYVRVSPNASQHTPSPRSKPVVTEGLVGPQPETQHGEDLRYGSGYPTSRQPASRERAQDQVPNADDAYSRKHDQTALYTTRDVNARADDTKRIPQIPSNSIPYTSEQRAEGTVVQRDGPQKDTYDVSQPVSIGNSRTRSESRNTQDISVSYSRRPYTTSRETYNTPSSQTQTSPHVSTSNHVPSSALTVPVLGPSPDQVQYSRLPPSIQQVPPSSKEVPTPPQPPQAPPMASTPSKKDYITPLPAETQNTGSSAPQPTTPRTYEVWLPPSSSANEHGPARSTPAPSSRRYREREQEPRRDQDYTRRISSSVQQVLREAPLITSQPAGLDPRAVKPYHYLKTRKIRTVSLVSNEAQDGTASTVIGSPTTSILSQAPIYIPPEQDPIIAAREWTEAGAILPGPRVRRPGLVWAELDDTPPIQQVEHRRPEPRSSRSRRPRLPGSRSREASDTDQPSS